MQDLDSLLNEGTSTDNTPQGQYNTLPDINPVDIETPNCTLAETSVKIDSKYIITWKAKSTSTPQILLHFRGSS